MDFKKRKKYKNFAIYCVLTFVGMIYLLAIYFAFVGNSSLTVSLIVFNSCFLVVLYFLLRFHKHATTTKKEE